MHAHAHVPNRRRVHATQRQHTGELPALQQCKTCPPLPPASCSLIFVTTSSSTSKIASIDQAADSFVLCTDCQVLIDLLDQMLRHEDGEHTEENNITRDFKSLQQVRTSSSSGCKICSYLARETVDTDLDSKSNLEVRLFVSMFDARFGTIRFLARHQLVVTDLYVQCQAGMLNRDCYIVIRTYLYSRR